MARRSLTCARKKARIWRAMEARYGTDFRCFWCETPVSRDTRLLSRLATLDHLVPRSAGGSNRIENIVVACAACNHNRSSLSPEEFLSSGYLVRRRKYRIAL